MGKGCVTYISTDPNGGNDTLFRRITCVTGKSYRCNLYGETNQYLSCLMKPIDSCIFGLTGSSLRNNGMIAPNTAVKMAV